MGTEEKRAKVTVVICTYNQENKIARALESVLASEGLEPEEMEVIVADDCSTDRTAEVAEETARGDRRVRVMKREKNLGMVRNYFEAVREARGEYIADVAGDDAWSSRTRLARAAKMLDEDAGLTMVHTGWCEVDAASGEKRERGAKNIAKDRRERIRNLLQHKEGCAPHLSTALYRKSIIMKAWEEHRETFESAWLTCEDLQTLTYLFAAGEIGYIDEPTLDYTVEAGTESAPKSAKKAAKYYCGVVRLMETLRGIEGIEREDVKEYYDRVARYVAGMARRQHDPEAARMLRATWKELGLGMPLRARINALLSR